MSRTILIAVVVAFGIAICGCPQPPEEFSAEQIEVK